MVDISMLVMLYAIVWYIVGYDKRSLALPILLRQ